MLRVNEFTETLLIQLTVQFYDVICIFHLFILYFYILHVLSLVYFPVNV